MTTCHLDFETRSTVNLPATGVYVYAGHPTTDVWCLAYAFDEGEVKVWRPGEPPPADMAAAVRGGQARFVGHNVLFEWCIWNAILVPRYGFPPLPIERCYCTMAMALAMALPASLAMAASAVGLPIEKDMEGRRLMLKMAKPRKIEDGGTIVWWDDKASVERLIAYCKTDVEVERNLGKRVLPLSAQERRVWLLDHKINARGIQFDIATVRKAHRLVDLAAERYNRRMAETTGGVVTACTQVRKLLDWIRSRGVQSANLDKAALKALLARGDLPADVRTALELRREAAKSSNAKLASIQDHASHDGRGRGLFNYHKASTGRWGGAGPQPHNLPRPGREYGEIEEIIGILERVA